MKSCLPAVILALVLAGANIAGAATTVWAFNASFGNPRIQAYDLATGNTVADFPAPNKDAQRGRANGRGIAVVGTTIYYTLADTLNVYKTDTVTHADGGPVFATSLAPGTPGINSLALAEDGQSFWMVGSQPNQNSLVDDKVYQYSLTGQLLRTLVLPLPQNTNFARNGIEVTPFGIVANQASVPYDLFDINTGNMITPGLITAAFRTTGIAFDGVDYIVVDVINQRLAIFDQLGHPHGFVQLAGVNNPLADCSTGNCIMDLSVVSSSQPAAAPQFSSAGVANAANYATGVISPGEIIAIFGSGLGPNTLTTSQLNAAGLVDTTLAGTRVLFDGVPAPVIYTKNLFLSVVVPYSVAGKSSVSVVVQYLGIASAPVTMSVTPAVPGIFTMDASGAGQGAIRNQDGITINSAATPAPRGSIVTLYCTGEGQTDIPGVDGQLAPIVLPLPKPLAQPVTVEIGGVPAEVKYAGAAPTLVAGVFQVNVLIPANALSGSASVVLHVGTASSRPDVTRPDVTLAVQ